MITEKDVLMSAENFIEVGKAFVKQYLRENDNFVNLEADCVDYCYFGLSPRLHSEKLYFLRLIDDKIMLFDYSLFNAKFNCPCKNSYYWFECLDKSKHDKYLYVKLCNDNYSVLPTLFSIIKHIMQKNNQF